MKVNKKIELLMELRESKAKQVRQLGIEVEDLTQKIWVEMKMLEEKGGKQNVERNNITSNIEPNDDNNNNSPIEEN